MLEEKNVEENKQVYVERVKLAKELSGLARDAGFVGFLIKYTATDGNFEIDRRFQKFAYDESNNEYLLAISKLLDYYEHYKEMRNIDLVLADIYERIGALEKKSEVPVVEEKKEKKVEVF